MFMLITALHRGKPLDTDMLFCTVHFDHEVASVVVIALDKQFYCLLNYGLHDNQLIGVIFQHILLVALGAVVFLRNFIGSGGYRFCLVMVLLLVLVRVIFSFVLVLDVVLVSPSLVLALLGRTGTRHPMYSIRGSS